MKICVSSRIQVGYCLRLPCIIIIIIGKFRRHRPSISLSHKVSQSVGVYLMETPKTPSNFAASFQKLDLKSIYPVLAANPNSISSFQSPVRALKRAKLPSLISLCLTVIGKHLEDIIPLFEEIAISFPADIKLAIAALARRRKLLNDDVIICLADASWETLDISCSNISDFGLAKVAETCRSLRAVDVSQCSKITPHGISELVEYCHSLETLRCGGCSRSDYAARRCLDIFKPELRNVEGDSWEELDATEITHGGQSLRWLVWPKVDPDSLENFSSECPRVKVNPQPLPFDYTGVIIPREAWPNIVLDDPIVEDIDTSAWATCGLAIKIEPPISSPGELSMAEKFRLAFVERDMRLAHKRAKNARQHQRRAEREWMMTNPEAKARAHASKITKSLRGKN